MIDTFDAKKRQWPPSARDLSIALRWDRADDAAAVTNSAGTRTIPPKNSMTREELFAALATKKIDSFHTSVLGFTLGSLMDRGVSDEEVRALCDLLIDQILKAKQNPETLASLEKFQTLVETQMGARS